VTGPALVAIALLALPVVGLVVRLLGGVPAPSAPGIDVVTLANSLGAAAVAAIGGTVLGAALALALHRLPPAAARWVAAVLTVPAIVPAYSMAIAWRPWVTDTTGLPDSAWSGYAAVVGVWVVTLYPFAMWCGLVALGRWRAEWTEAAWLVGRTATRLRRAWLLAAVRPAFVVAWLWALGDFAVPDLFRVRVLATELFADIAAYGDWSAAALRVLPTTVIAAVGLAWLGRDTANWAPSATDQRPHADPGSSVAIGAGLGVAAGVGLLVLVPLATLAATAAWSDRRAALGWLVDAVGTLELGLLTALLVVPLAFAVAWRARRARLPPALRGLACFVWLLPGGAVGIGMSALPPPLAGSLLALALALAAKWLWPALELARLAVRLLPPAWEDAAATVGASPWRTLRAITLPALRGPLAVAAAAAVIVASHDLALSVLVGPPGLSTLALRLFSTVHYGSESLVAALSLGQAACGLVLGAALLGATRAWPGRTL
jgi:ABC-type Fe3+ transport system permease subunit